MLDAVLKLLYDAQNSPEQVIAAGFDAVLIERVQALIRRSAFKRKQMAKALPI